MTGSSDLTLILPTTGPRLALCLILFGALTQAAPTHTTTQFPWINPCGGEEASSTNIPRDMLRTVSVPRQPSWDNPALFTNDMRQLVSSTEDVASQLKQYLITHHFGQNTSLVSTLMDHPFIWSFNEELGQLLVENSVPLLYENLVKVAIFLETIRKDLAADQLRTRNEEEMESLLGVLARGGWYGNKHVEAGVYQILCRIFNYLAANGQGVDNASTLNHEIIPHNLRDPNSKAERHNRDFVVLQTMMELLSSSRSALRNMHRLARSNEKKNG